MENNIIKLDNSEVLCCFKVNEKMYCALVDKESISGDIYFLRRTDIDENNCVLTSVPDTEINAVIKEYDRLVDFFETEDELDLEDDL